MERENDQNLLRQARRDERVAARNNTAAIRSRDQGRIATTREELAGARERVRRRQEVARRPMTGRDVVRQGVRDGDDGVRRCIDCNWEIEDGACGHW